MRAKRTHVFFVIENIAPWSTKDAKLYDFCSLPWSYGVAEGEKRSLSRQERPWSHWSAAVSNPRDFGRLLKRLPLIVMYMATRSAWERWMILRPLSATQSNRCVENLLSRGCVRISHPRVSASARSCTDHICRPTPQRISHQIIPPDYYCMMTRLYLHGGIATPRFHRDRGVTSTDLSSSSIIITSIASHLRTQVKLYRWCQSRDQRQEHMKIRSAWLFASTPVSVLFEIARSIDCNKFSFLIFNSYLELLYSFEV